MIDIIQKLYKQINKCKQNSIEYRKFQSKKRGKLVKKNNQQMVILSYNHAFTLKQLEVIITQYLQLGPYNQCLQKVIKSYMAKYLTLPLQQRHNQQNQHPIKLPINFYKYSSKHSDLMDKDQYKGQYEYIYPLPVIVQIMNSTQFYNQLPKNIIINHLLTTTNISIIIETLSILSQDLSKLVKSTLDSVQDKKVTKYISTLVSGCLEWFQDNLDGDQGEGVSISGKKSEGQQKRQQPNKDLLQVRPFMQKNIRNSIQNFITESDIKTIRIESDFQLSKKAIPQNNQRNTFKRKPSRKQSIIATLLKKQDLSQQDPKSVVKNLKTLFIEDQMLRPLWLIDQENDENNQQDSKRLSLQLEELQKAIARKPKQFRQCEYCRNYRSYLIQSTGLSYFDLHQISRIPTELYKVLKRIKSVINVFTLYLKETNRTTIPANINVLNKILSSIQLVITEDIWQNDTLNPSVKKNSNNYVKQNKKAYKLINEMQPYFNQVYNYKSHDNNEFTIDQLLKICLKASQLKDVQKNLVEKYMNEARMKKDGKDIQTFCITKQNLNTKSHQENNQLLIGETKSTDFKPVLDQIQLLREYEKQQTIINRAAINSKPIYTQINKKYQDQVTMGSQIKRHKNQSNSKNEKKELQKSQTIKQFDKNKDARQNQKFKMIMYQQFMRNQGFNVTKHNITAIINQNMSKGQKNTNFFNKDLENSVELQLKDSINESHMFNPSKIVRNSANTFSSAQLKYDQDASTSYQKKETQIYNKMLLNGEAIRNQVLNQVQYGDAVIYESMEDFLKKLEQMNSDVEKQEKLCENQNQEEDLFMTMYGSNIRKTTPAMKKTQKNQESLRNSRKTDLLTPTKTPKSNFQTKFSSLSNSKGVRFSTKDKLNLIQDTTNKNQTSLKKTSSQKKQTSKQVSIKQVPYQGCNENLQIKKPDWLNQFVQSYGSENNQKINSKKSQNMLQNQRFKQFQQKNLLRECLSAEKLDLQSKNKNNSQKRQLKSCKTMTNLKRPVSAFCQPSKNSSNTVKSLGRALNGKRRSYILSKQFEVENNSLLTKIYKQNIQGSPLGNAKKQLRQEKAFDDFKNKIEKGKFTVDKFLS